MNHNALSELQIAAQLPVALALFDRQLRVVALTPRWRDQYALRPGVGPGTPINDFASDLPASWLRAVARALTGEEQHHSGESWTHADGSARSVRWWINPWRGSHGQLLGVMITAEDVTTEFRAAHSLQALQQRTQHFARLGSDLFWELDAGLRFRVEPELNPPRFWGASGPLLGAHPWGLLGSQDLLPELADQRVLLEAHLPFRDCITQRTLAHGETQWLAWSGDPCFDENGQFAGYIGTTRDVTAQQQFLQALQQSELRLSTALQASSNALWELDVCTGQASLFAGYAEMLGYTLADLNGSGRSWDFMLHPDDREAVMTVFGSLRGQVDERFETHFRLRHRLGHWVSVRCRGKVAADGCRLVCVNADVTVHEDAQLREELAALVFGNVQQGMVVADLHGVVVAANAKFSEIMEYAPAELIGAPIQQILAAAPAHQAAQDYVQMMASGVAWEGEVWHTRKGGEVFQDWMMVTPLLDVNGRVIRRVFLLTDLSRMKHARSDLEMMAYHDPLTGLANRRQMDARLSYTLAHARRDEASFSLIMIDLDGFKHVNDAAGHQAGDELLVAVSRRLKALLREVDLVVRLGGDEFVLILERADATGSARVARKVLELIANPLQLSNGNVTRVTASLGVAVYPGDGDDSSRLLRLADERMYRAKATGRHGAVLQDGSRIDGPGASWSS